MKPETQKTIVSFCVRAALVSIIGLSVFFLDIRMRSESKEVRTFDAISSSSANSNKEPKTMLTRSNHSLLMPVPKDLMWIKVPQKERTNNTCGSPFRHCCIGQSRQEKNLVMPGTNHYEKLLVKPAGSLIDISGLLRTMHETTKDLDAKWCTLAFVGDSLSSDHQIAAMCQLSQKGYETLYCDFKAGPSYGADNTLCKKSFQPRSKNGDASYFEMVSNSSKYCPRIRVSFFNGVRNNFDVNLPLLNRNDDEAGVIVLNHGVHCNDRTCMDKYMDDKFVPLYNTYMKVHQQNFFLLWREHEPQHFDNPASSGLYKKGDGPKRCTGNISHFDNFRNEIALEYLRKNTTYSNVGVVPLFDQMKKLHYFHVNGDCTHYAYNPWRFDVTWHGIARELQILSKESR